MIKLFLNGQKNLLIGLNKEESILICQMQELYYSLIPIGLVKILMLYNYLKMLMLMFIHILEIVPIFYNQKMLAFLVHLKLIIKSKRTKLKLVILNFQKEINHHKHH